MRSSAVWMKLALKSLMSEIVAIIITGTHDDVERSYRRLETLLYRLISVISQHELYHYIISGFSYYSSNLE